MKRSKIAGLILTGIITLSFGALAMLTKLYVADVFEAQNRDLFQRVREKRVRILQDMKSLDSSPLFPDTEARMDAAPLFSHALKDKYYLEVKARHSNFLKSDGMKKLLEDPDLDKLNVTWFDGIVDFDHWNISTSEAFQSMLEKAKESPGKKRIEIFLNLPLPDFKSLQFISVLRFLQLSKTGELEKGLQLIRKLASLSHTTDTLSGSMSAVTLLNLEHTIAQAFQVSDWTLIDREQINAYKRLTWVWGTISYLASWYEMPQEFEPFLKRSLGACAQVQEKVIGLGIHDYLQASVPFEPQYARLIQQDLSWSQKLFNLCAKPEFMFLLKPAYGKPNPDSKIPFYRRSVGLTALSNMAPDYLKQYD